MWKRIKPFFTFCGLTFNEKFKPIWSHKAMRYLYLLIAFILSVVVSNFLGIPLLDLVKPIFRLLSYQWWIIIGLLVVIAFWMLLLDGARQYHERIVGEINTEREAERTALLSLAKRVHQLGEIQGRASEIERRYSGTEIPEDVLYDWRGLLQTALLNCYGRAGAAKFYRNQNATEISRELGYVWFSSHYHRLSDFITEEIQEWSIAHKATIQKR
jgi:hypothetical protein